MSDAKTLQTAPTQTQFPQANNPPIGTVTSSFFVSMDDLFAVTNVENKDIIKNAAGLLWFSSIEQRPSIGTMTSDFQASATLVHSLLEMHILTDSTMPILRQQMRNNQVVEKIKITRVGHLGEGKENTELYSSTFTNCFLESIEEFPDKLIVKARITERADSAITTDFEGKPGPVTASAWDYVANVDSS